MKIINSYQRNSKSKPVKFRIWDNGGKTCDRYTVAIDGMFFGFSDDPFSPIGFSQYCGDIPKGMRSFKHLGKQVRFSELSKDVQNAIIDRME